VRINFTNTAIRALAKLPKDVRDRILAKINDLAENPDAFPKVKALQGADGLRIRVGDYRVIFIRDAEVITIRDVGHRSTIYD
jgi:mRNA interferase RelE/StbE